MKAPRKTCVAPIRVVVSTEPPPDSERNMFASDWRWSMRDNPAYSAMPMAAYRRWFDFVAAYYLGDMDQRKLVLRGGCTLITLRNVERPTFVAGWCLLDQSKADVTAIVWAYVKKELKHLGFGRLLLKAALDAAGDDDVVHLLKLRDWQEDKADEYGVGYVPIERVMQRRSA